MKKNILLGYSIRILSRLKAIRYVVMISCVSVFLLLVLTSVYAIPSSPQITYISNSTFVSTLTNRSTDQKGTITILSMALNQQDYRWKAYVGNVTGNLVLDDANANTIYDWSLAVISGEVYVTRASSVSWSNVSCVNNSVIINEQSALGMGVSDSDNINRTFNYTVHRSFLVGTKNITNSSCRSTFTYVNDAPQTVSESARFQEILLKDDISGSLIYTTLLEQDQLSYDGSNTYDFQIIVAENESSSTPTNYYFYVELG
ncbi:MAG: hypothetical protein KatS3mg002_1224 [Candidatus Woesearchaeota archaeon]|nr:MAG: hypothetical protein KatS3mg002_1224 [Candidatus Woesearchaeota archaeon]